MEANRSGDMDRGSRRRQRSSDEEKSDHTERRLKRLCSKEGHDSHRCNPVRERREQHRSHDGRDFHRDPCQGAKSRNHHSDFGRRNRDVNQDVRVLDQFGKEQVSANNPGKELADQSAEHQSVKKRADQLAKEHPAKELANRSGGKPASVFEQFPKKPASVSKQSPKCSKKPVAVSISSQSTKNNVSVSVAGESADPTPCLVFENVFEKSVVIAFDESVKKEDSDLSLEVEEFVHEQCARFGGTVLDLHVEMSHGLVYVRFADVRFAVAAKQKLDGTSYKTTQLIRATFIEDTRYWAMFGRKVLC